MILSIFDFYANITELVNGMRLLGFHNMMHFDWETYQIGVKLNAPDGATGRCIVDGMMWLKQFSWIYTFPLRSIIVYDFRVLQADGPDGPKFEIFRQEEMW